MSKSREWRNVAGESITEIWMRCERREDIKGIIIVEGG